MNIPDLCTSPEYLVTVKFSFPMVRDEVDSTFPSAFSAPISAMLALSPLSSRD